ncbi:hypothetical protein ACFYO1_25955 [Nocardia sp. NPDC006044]|uniref:hypothetical protein n=1 Tax=Nocardia sp. NPDC006044 TaxID=3364306 RepID=UPI003674CA95
MLMLAIGLFAYNTPNPLQVIGSALGYALASLLAGGLLGFLFGIPRALTFSRDGDNITTAESGRAPRFAGNTNLEQISDWLTKIIVGATLTQLGTIADGGQHLFTAVAPSLGGMDGSASFGGALIVFSAIAGFIGGWLFTRLYLGRALTAADRAIELLDEADRAEVYGESERASELRREAAELLGAVASSAADYERLRETEDPSRERTRRMEEVVSSARHLSSIINFDRQTVRNIFDQDSDGNRIVAIALMQANPSLADISRLAHTVNNSRSAFEQYQALVALSMSLSRDLSITSDQRQLIDLALKNERIKVGTSRYEIARQINELLQLYPQS